MNIYATYKGTGGYDCDREESKKAGLEVGRKYELDNASVGRWISYIYLSGVSGRFNSVMFDFTDENGEDISITSIPEFQTYL